MRSIPIIKGIEINARIPSEMKLWIMVLNIKNRTLIYDIRTSFLLIIMRFFMNYSLKIKSQLYSKYIYAMKNTIMQKRSLFFVLIFLFFCTTVFSQQIQILNNNTKTSLRGLSVVSNKIIWVSGSKGTVGRSIDAGKTWEWITVKNYETRDFRDIEAFDKNTAVIMGIAEPAVILKTTDGGKNWKTVFTDSTKGMFLDAMEFW